MFPQRYSTVVRAAKRRVSKAPSAFSEGSCLGLDSSKLFLKSTTFSWVILSLSQSGERREIRRKVNARTLFHADNEGKSSHQKTHQCCKYAPDLWIAQHYASHHPPAARYPSASSRHGAPACWQPGAPYTEVMIDKNLSPIASDKMTQLLLSSLFLTCPSPSNLEKEGMGSNFPQKLLKGTHVTQIWPFLKLQKGSKCITARVLGVIKSRGS